MNSNDDWQTAKCEVHAHFRSCIPGEATKESTLEYAIREIRNDNKIANRIMNSF